MINIQEVSNAADSNVILYPKEDSRNMYAYMNFDTSSKIVIEDPNGIHYHYTKARIKHKVTNQVSGLTYTFLENHLFTFYRYFDNISHRKLKED